MRATLVALFIAGYAATANAAIIVDTGTPDNSTGWSFGTFQYFGAEFDVADATTITQVEGYFGNQWGASGNVAFALHADGGNAPGSVLFSSNIMLGTGAALDWYSASGLNWNVGAGTYWVSFMPDQNIQGTMPGYAPDPLAAYAQASGNYAWDGGEFNYLDVGVRVHGGSASVPDEASHLVWVSVALFGLGARWFGRKNRIG